MIGYGGQQTLYQQPEAEHRQQQQNIRGCGIAQMVCALLVVVAGAVEYIVYRRVLIFVCLWGPLVFYVPPTASLGIAAGQATEVSLYQCRKTAYQVLCILTAIFALPLGLVHYLELYITCSSRADSCLVVVVVSALACFISVVEFILSIVGASAVCCRTTRPTVGTVVIQGGSLQPQPYGQTVTTVSY